MRVIGAGGGQPPADTTPPQVSIFSPAPGAVVTGSIVVSACAADDNGVASVQFKVDGTNLGAADTQAPFSIAWDTTAAAAGIHTLTAVARDAAGNTATSTGLAVTVSNITLTPWPHEPAGLVRYVDWGVGALSGSGWNTVNPNGNASIVSDLGAGVSAPFTGQWKYPAGFAGGSAPATMYYPLPAAFTQGFVGVEWKASNPWQGHSSFVNKIYFLLGGSCGNLIPIMYGPPGGPYDLRVAPEWGSNWSFLTPNVNNVPVSLGTWHKIELYFKYNSPGTGVVQWWMDGMLIGDYRNLTFPASGCFTEFQLSPTWGGVGGTKSQTDYFWFDHVYVSR